MHRFIAAVFVIAGLLVAACGDDGSDDSSSAAGSTGAGEVDQVTVGAFPLDLLSAGVQGKRFDQPAVKAVSIDSGPAALPLLQSGSLDAISGIATVPLATALATRIDYRIVWITNIDDPMRLVAKADSAEGLRGKNVGLPIGSVAQFFFEEYLEKNGMSPDDVKEVDVPPPSMLASFDRGAIVGGYAWAPFWRQLKDAGGQVLDRRGAKEFLVVRKDFVDQNPNAVQALVCQLADIHKEFQDDPGALYGLLSKTTEQPVSTLKTIYPQTNPGPGDQTGADLLGEGGTPSNLAADLHAAAEWLKTKNQIPIVPSLEEFQAVFAPEFAQKAKEGRCG